MVRPGWKSMLLVAVVTLGLVSVTSEANACRWWGCGCGPACCGWGGYWGGYGCGYGCGCGIYGGYCGVPVRPCGCGWYRGCGYGGCGWGGSYGCGTCGYSCGTCSTCGWGTCSSCDWGTPVVSGCCGATTYTGAVTVPMTPTPAPTPAPAPKAEMPAVAPPEVKPTPATPAPVPPALTPTSPSAKPTAAPLPIPAAPGKSTTLSTPTMDTSAILTVYVPAEAKVTINGKLTRTAGSKRQYVSFGLMPGFSYKYEVKAELVRDGQLVEDTKVISLTAGERGALAFGFNLRSAEGLAASY